MTIAGWYAIMLTGLLLTGHIEGNWFFYSIIIITALTEIIVTDFDS